MIPTNQKPLLSFDYQAGEHSLRVSLYSPIVGVWQLEVTEASSPQDTQVHAAEHCTIQRNEEDVFYSTQPFYVKDEKGNALEHHYRFFLDPKTLHMHAQIDDQTVWQTEPSLKTPLAIEVDKSGLHVGLCAHLASPIYGGGSPSLPDLQGRLKTLPKSLQTRLAKEAKESTGLGDRTGSSLHSAQTGFCPLLWSPLGWGLSLKAAEVQHELGTQNPQWHEMFTQGPFTLSMYLGSPAEIFSRHGYLTGRLSPMPLWSVGLGWKTAIDDVDATLEAAKTLEVAVDALHCESEAVVRWDDKQQIQPTGDLLLPEKVRCVLDATPLTRDEVPSSYCVKHQGKPIKIHGAYCLDLTQETVAALWEKGMQNAYPHAQFRLPVDQMLSALTEALGAQAVTTYQEALLSAAYQLSARDQLPVQGVCYGVPVMPQHPQWPLQKLIAAEQSWAGLQQLHRQHLALENGGHFSLYHDLSVFKTPDPELFLRLMAYISFTPANVLSGDMLTYVAQHAEFGPEVMEKAHELLRFRSRLVPYFYGLLSEEARNGGPVMRTMGFEFPQDPVCWQYPDQYLLGASLLIAPVLEAGQTEATVYLPAGSDWWHIGSGERFEGGQCVTVPAPLGTVPAFGRDGHMLCLGHVLPNIDAFDSGKILSEVWLFGMPIVQPTVMRNKIRILCMQGSSYVKGLEGLSIVQPKTLQFQRRGSEVRISRRR